LVLSPISQGLISSLISGSTEKLGSFYERGGASTTYVGVKSTLSYEKPSSKSRTEEMRGLEGGFTGTRVEEGG
jgi:hypothetical protein